MEKIFSNKYLLLKKHCTQKLYRREKWDYVFIFNTIWYKHQDNELSKNLETCKIARTYRCQHTCRLVNMSKTSAVATNSFICLITHCSNWSLIGTELMVGEEKQKHINITTTEVLRLTLIGV